VSAATQASGLMDFHPRPNPQKSGPGGSGWGATMRAAGGKTRSDSSHCHFSLRWVDDKSDISWRIKN